MTESYTVGRRPGRPPKVRVQEDAAPQTQSGPEVEASETEDQAAQPELAQEAPDPLADAPRHGQRIILIGPEGEEAEGYWRTTRTYSPMHHKWVPIAYWADPLRANIAIKFQPVAWRELPS